MPNANKRIAHRPPVRVRGKRYDPRTAQLVDTWKEGALEEALYRKNTGEYFLYITLDSFPEPVNPVSPRPLTNEEAEEWTQKRMGKSLLDYLDVAADEQVMMSFTATSSFREALRNRATDEGRPMGTIIIEAVTDYIEGTQAP